MSNPTQRCVGPILWLAATVCLATSCGDDLCTRANARFFQCTGEALPVDEQCDEGAAEDLLLLDCETVAGAYGKADAPCPPGGDCQPSLVALGLEALPARVSAVSDQAPLDKLKIWVGEILAGTPAEIALFVGDVDEDRDEEEAAVPPAVDDASLVRWARVQPGDWFAFDLRGSYLLQVEAIDEQTGLWATISPARNAAVDVAPVHEEVGDDLPRLALARLSEAGSAVSFRYRDALHLLQVEDVKRLFGWRRVVSTIARCPGSCLGESPLTAADGDAPPDRLPLQFELAEEDPRCPREPCDEAQGELSAMRVTYSEVDWWGPFAEQQATLSVHGPREAPAEPVDDKHAKDGEPPSDQQQQREDTPTEEPTGDETLKLEMTHTVEGLRVTATVKICGDGADEAAGTVELKLMPAGHGKVQTVSKQLLAGARVEDGCALTDLVLTVGQPGKYHALATFNGDDLTAQSEPQVVDVGAPATTPSDDDHATSSSKPSEEGEANLWIVDITRRSVEEKVIYTVFACHEGLQSEQEFEIGLYLQKAEPPCGKKPDIPPWTVTTTEEKRCKRYETEPAESVAQVWARTDISCEAVDEANRDDNLKGKSFAVRETAAEERDPSREDRRQGSPQRDERGERRDAPAAMVAGGGCQIPAAGTDPIAPACLLLLALALRAARIRRR